MSASSQVELAARIGGTARVIAIRLPHVDFTLGPASPRGDLVPTLDLTTNWEYLGDDGVLVFQVNVQIVATTTGDGDEPTADREIFTCTIAYFLAFGLPSGFAIDDAEAEAFARVSVEPMVFPYVRELVHSLTGRAGLPPLVLEPWRVTVGPPQGE